MQKFKYFTEGGKMIRQMTIWTAISLLHVFIAAVMAGCASSQTKPFLWSIEKGGRVSYVFGAVHAGVSAADLDPSVRERLVASSAYVGELDGKAAAGDPHSTLELSASARGLDEMLSPAAWRNLQMRLRGAPVERLKRMNPFFAMYLLDDVGRRERALRASPSATATVSPITAVQPMDEDLLATARVRGLTIAYLEEKTETLRGCVEQAIAHDLEEKLIAQQPRFPDAQRPPEEGEVARVAAAYRSGDLNRIARLEAEEEKQSSTTGECSIGGRNPSWVEKIDRLHDVYAPAFFSVGIGHIVTSPNSLLELLKQKGFTVARLAAHSRNL